MINRLRVVTLIAFTAVLTAVVSTSAHAQKPALTQNIDEKGRVPYSDSSFVPCGSPLCFVILNRVPVGYRLVITQVSVIYAGSAAGGENWVFLKTDKDNSAPSSSTLTPNLVFPAVYSGPDTSTGGGVFVVSAPVTYYVDPGVYPIFQINNNNGSSPNIAIFGYIVALNP